MNTTQPHIDEILRAFFEHELAGRRGPVTRQRITRVYQRLLECLETEAEAILADDDRVLLAAEREFQSVGAMARTMHAENLFDWLFLFLLEPWLDPYKQDRQDQRVQLRLTSALIDMLVSNQLIDWSRRARLLAELRAAIRSASRTLNARQLPQRIPGQDPWR
ncbi:hypothetical protein E3O44_10450 [Cryobacterium algoricola]|uniref:Uncharacterized protein n=1 Tax=Cryobacterium algoricola TaxID=1259183 RepID=A0ABY2IF47_9MICO|nr:hypothetical protein [Cryobacterium algoricola]TFB87506.1 hypothetical protein E3O44_10450 [Cryobacterium algoricola]